MSTYSVPGAWIRGPHSGTRARIDEVQAGRVRGVRLGGGPIDGYPDDFLADTGESGDELLKLLLPSPQVASLFRGAIRETIAAFYSIALFGQQETRAWDGANQYIIDDGEGNCGAVLFTPQGAAGAVHNHNMQIVPDPMTAIASAAANQREIIQSIIELPIFRVDDTYLITALFWTMNGRLCGAEMWHQIYACGAELMRHELMPDDRWADEAHNYYGLDCKRIKMILQIVERNVLFDQICQREQGIVMSPEEVAALVPIASEYRSLAIEQIEQSAFIRIC